MKIAIFQSDLHVGGIQRSLVNLLWLLKEHRDIKIDVFIFDSENIFYNIEEIKKCENYRIIFLNKFPYYNRFIPYKLVKRLYGSRLLKEIKEQTEPYDVAIDFNSYWNECAVGAALIPAKKRICWVHNDVIIKIQEEWKYRLLHFFFKKKYSEFDCMGIVSEGIREPFYKLNGSVAPKKNIIIPNAINTDEIGEKLKEPPKISVNSQKINFVSVGRLCHQKGFDLLIDLINTVKINHPEKIIKMHFYIAGEGPDREKLLSRIKNKNLEEYITLTGNLENPFSLMKQCDAFVLTSRYEGQGMVLWEAVAAGLPIIIPKHLEKYSTGIKGRDDMMQAIISVDKNSRKFTMKQTAEKMEKYNNKVLKQISELKNGIE